MMERHIEIAGRGLRMKYTVNSLCAVEDRAGRPLDQMMDRQFTAARLLLWGGLIECQPEMTVAATGDLIGEAIARDFSPEEQAVLYGALARMTENARRTYRELTDEQKT